MTTPRTTAQEKAARLRAARDYSGLTFMELAARAGVSPDTLKHAAAHNDPQAGRIDDESLRRVAEVAQVPMWFMHDGWDGAVSLDELFQAWVDNRLDAEVLTRFAAQLRFGLEDRLDDEGKEMLWRVFMLGKALTVDEQAALRDVMRDRDAPDTGKTVSPAAATGKHVARAAKTGKASSARPRVDERS